MWWLITQQIDRGDRLAAPINNTLTDICDAGVFELVRLVEDSDRSLAIVLLKTIDEFVVRCQLSMDIDGGTDITEKRVELPKLSVDTPTADEDC